MDIDPGKIDEAELALLYPTLHDRPVLCLEAHD
jgi:hypothetical protein